MGKEQRNNLVVVPVIKNDLQLIAAIIIVIISNYALFRIFIYLYDKFEYLQTAIGGLLILIVPICFVFAVLIEITMLYESKQQVQKLG